MTTFAKYLSAAVVSLGAVFGSAQADDPRPVPTAVPVRPGVNPHPTPGGHRPRDTDYAVYYRAGGFAGWRQYDTFETRDAAERAEHRLERRGYQTRVVRVTDRDRPHTRAR